MQQDESGQGPQRPDGRRGELSCRGVWSFFAWGGLEVSSFHDGLKIEFQGMLPLVHPPQEHLQQGSSDSCVEMKPHLDSLGAKTADHHTRRWGPGFCGSLIHRGFQAEARLLQDPVHNRGRKFVPHPDGQLWPVKGKHMQSWRQRNPSEIADRRRHLHLDSVWNWLALLIGLLQELRYIRDTMQK